MYLIARPSRQEYSYISIFLDQDGRKSTIEKYEVPGKEEKALMHGLE